jgi:hypothetical protein
VYDDFRVPKWADEQTIGAGIFFSPSLDVARRYGEKVRAVLLKIEHPKIIDVSKAKGKGRDWLVRELSKARNIALSHRLGHLEPIGKVPIDGAIIVNWDDDDPNKTPQYVAFFPEQCKLVSHIQ